MKTPTKTFAAVISGILFCIFLGCAALEQFVQRPTVTLDKTDVTNISLTEGTLLFRFNVANPNPIGVTVQKVSYHLNLNEKNFINGVLNKGITIKASGSAPFELPVTVRYQEFFQSIQELFKSDRIAYDLNGALSIGPFEVPYKTKGTLPVPKLPEISLKSVKVARLSLAGAAILFRLHMKNDNSFSVSPGGLHYRIALGGVQFAEGDAAQIQTLQEKGESLIELPLNVSFIEFGRSAYNMLTKSSSQYEISGDIKLNIPQLGMQQFPFQKSGEVSFLK